MKQRHSSSFASSSSSHPPAPDRRLPVVSLLALASGIFLAQTAEFLPGGLVPQISDDLGIGVGLVGQMVTVFAFTVVVATAPLAIVTARIGRKTLVVVSLAILSLSNVLVAIAPAFEGIVVGRVVGALAHGLFWAVVSTYAVEIVPREKLGRAMAFTAAGGSLAGILGIPIGNALGELFGWRLAFASVAVAGVAVTLVLWRWLPRIDSAPVDARTPRRRIAWDRTAFGIAVICVLILVLVLGQTSFGPYTTVWLEDVAGLARSTVPLYLLITGAAGALGAVAAGHLYDRYPRATFAVSGALLACCMAAFPLAADGGLSPALLAIAIGSSISFAGLPMMLQTRMMHTASPAMRRVAGAVQTTVFNIAIGGGALLGGLVVSGIGVQVLPWVAVGGAVVTTLLALLWDAARASPVGADRAVRPGSRATGPDGASAPPRRPHAR